MDTASEQEDMTKRKRKKKEKRCQVTEDWSSIACQNFFFFFFFFPFLLKRDDADDAEDGETRMYLLGHFSSIVFSSMVCIYVNTHQE